VPHEIPLGADVIVPDPVPARLTESTYADELPESVNVAVTDCAEFIDTAHEPVPLHAPPQPVNVDPLAALAVRLTDDPVANDAEQVLPQEMPAGADETVPLPVPPVCTVSVCVGCVPNSKSAVTASDEFMVTVQLPVPLHAPPQPANTDPAAALAESVTAVPPPNDAEQLLPQAIDPVVDVTVPVPTPVLLTLSVYVGFDPPPSVPVVALLPPHAQAASTIPAAHAARRITPSQWG
jgi:hypothetical protein